MNVKIKNPFLIEFAKDLNKIFYKLRYIQEQNGERYLDASNASEKIETYANDTYEKAKLHKAFSEYKKYIDDDFKNSKNKAHRFLLDARRLETLLASYDFIVHSASNFEKGKFIQATTANIIALSFGYVGWRAVEKGIKIENIQTINSISPKSIESHQTETTQEDLINELRKGSQNFFKELTSKNRRYGHFEIENEKRFIDTSIYHKESDKNILLFESLQSIWGEDCRHALLLGEGGMGKTLSFMRLWQFFLKDKTAPIPIYISLNEYTTEEKDKQNFLIKYIAWNYLGIKPLDEKTEQRLRKLFVDKSHEKLSFFLFLDGFNEITVDKKHLLDDLNNNWKTKAWNTQIIISSRHDMRYAFNFKEFHLLQINMLPREVIINYLRHYEVAFSSISNFQSLLENPMMLSLYANSAPTIEKYKHNPNFNFKPIESQGELLWNYFESQYVKYFEYYSSDETKTHFYRFLFKHYLPFLGHEMERNGKYFLVPKELDKILKQTGGKFYSTKFTNAFREYKKFIRYFDLKPKDDEFEEDERIENFSEIISKELQLLIIENKYFWFQHQSFRDYFAAIHIINEMEIQILEEEFPQVLYERVLPVYLQRFIGQIEGEHHYKPTIVDELGWTIDYKDTFHYDNKVSKTKTLKLLDLCRNKFGEKDNERAIQNLISILKTTREELSGLDLSNLDLLSSDLKGVRCFRKNNEDYLSAKFDGSLVEESNFITQGHTMGISCVAYSPNGRKIATASGDHTLKEWSVTGVVLRTYIGHSEPLTSVVYNSDGSRILSSSWDHTAKEWSTETGECLHTFEEPDVVSKSIYSPDDKRIVCGLFSGIIKVWSAETKEQLHEMEDNEYSYSIEALTFNKDGSHFLSGSGQIVKEWDTVTAECIGVHDYIGNMVNTVIYMPGDEDNALCGVSGALFGIISLSKKKGTKPFRIEHFSEQRVMSIAMNGNGKEFLASTDKGNVYLWSITEELPKRKFEILKGRINSIVYSPDEQKFTYGSFDKFAEELSITTGETLQSFGASRNEINCVDYSPSGKRFVLGSSEGKIQEWDTVGKKCINVYLGHIDSIEGASYNHLGDKIISCSHDKTVKLWSVETSKCLHTFSGHEDKVYCVSFSPDGSLVASGSGDKTIRIWSTLEKKCIKIIREPTFTLHDLSFSPDGKKILSVSRGNVIKEWSVETGECLKVYSAHRTSIYSCDYSPKGDMIISGSRDHNIKLWKVETGECLNTVHAQNNGVHSVVFSPDGKKVLSCGCNIFLNEWVIGEEAKDENKIKAHEENIMQVAYSPDGKKALSCSVDGTVKEWLVEDWSCIETYKYVHELYVHGCSFKEVHENSVLSDENKIIFEKHGALFKD